MPPKPRPEAAKRVAPLAPSDLAPSDLAPSDLAKRQLKRGQRLVVAGRVLGVPQAQVLLVGDALASARIELEPSQTASPTPGDLVQVEGRWNGSAIVSAELSTWQSAPETTGHGEFSRLAWRGVGRALAQRSLAYATIRNYFHEHTFVEVTTPSRVRTPGLDANVHALRAKPDWLSTSPEFHMKRLLVGGLPRIFQLAPCFRAEELGTLHEPEFTMLEWYRAFESQDAVIQDTEELVQRVVQALCGRSWVRWLGKRIDVTPPFARLSVSDAFRRYAGVSDAPSLAAEDVDRFYELFVERVEPALARRSKPVFLTDYPISEAALARPRPDAPEVAERFELYLGGVELCNGFSELTDAKEQRRRFEAERRERRRARQPVYAIDERFLSALEEGMPPAGGNALGVDRLVLLALGAESMADVMSFPEAWR